MINTINLGSCFNIMTALGTSYRIDGYPIPVWSKAKSRNFAFDINPVVIRPSCHCFPPLSPIELFLLVSQSVGCLCHIYARRLSGIRDKPYTVVLGAFSFWCAYHPQDKHIDALGFVFGATRYGYSCRSFGHAFRLVGMCPPFLPKALCKGSCTLGTHIQRVSILYQRN